MRKNCTAFVIDVPISWWRQQGWLRKIYFVRPNCQLTPHERRKRQRCDEWRWCLFSSLFFLAFDCRFRPAQPCVEVSSWLVQFWYVTRAEQQPGSFISILVNRFCHILTSEFAWRDAKSSIIALDTSHNMTHQYHAERLFLMCYGSWCKSGNEVSVVSRILFPSLI